MNRSLRLVGLVEAERLVGYYAQAYRMASLSHGRIELWEEGANWALESLEHREMGDKYSPEASETIEVAASFTLHSQVSRHWQKTAELGWQNLAELCGHVTRGTHKRTLLRPALLFFSFPFSSFRFSFIDNPIV